MPIAALNILKTKWGHMLFALLLAGGGVWLGTFITQHDLHVQALAFSDERQALTDSFSEEKAQWHREKSAAASQYARDLKAALDVQQGWKEKADALSLEMAGKERAHSRNVQELQRRLDDALKRDGSSYTGIGPASLQLWRGALGYTGAESLSAGHAPSDAPGMAAGHTGDAVSTGGGLSPAGIVLFSSEYGRWCLMLRDRLQAINDYYR